VHRVEEIVVEVSQARVKVMKAHFIDDIIIFAKYLQRILLPFKSEYEVSTRKKVCKRKIIEINESE